MIQWHPLFAQLLRSLVEDYYAVETNVPVGDLPREADILLLRRTTPAPPPFHGIWQHLTQWNVLEFKGPSDDPALRDLDLLVEVGLGIDRRFNEQRVQDGQAVLERAEVSFWYLANHLGRRFLAEAQDLFGECTALTEGLWRCRALRHAVFLVSRDTLPVEPDTVPLHLVCREADQVKLQLTQVVLQQPGWWQRFGSFLLAFHPHLKQEIERMAQQSGVEDEVDLRPLFEMVGPPEAIKQAIQMVGPSEALKQAVQAAGPSEALKQVVQAAGPSEALKQVVQAVGLEELLASLTPEQRAELKQRLQ